MFPKIISGYIARNLRTYEEYTVVPPYLLIQYRQFQLSGVYSKTPPPNTHTHTQLKIKEINSSWVSKHAPSKNGLQHGEIQQPKHGQYLTHLPLSPYPHFPHRPCLHSASSVLAVRISCCVTAVFVFRRPLFIN
jgi:hypothetical protein